MNTIHEPARDLPVNGDFDVVVVGGGIAGVAAAVSAGRNGASVCIVERYCGLGGLATLGNVTIWLPLCDGRGRQVVGGLGEELLRLSVADLSSDHGAARFCRVPDCWQPDGDPAERTRTRFKVSFNPASYMLALEKLIVDCGVKLLYDTRFCDVRRNADRVTHVIIENKSGRSALGCRVVIDASGDADACAAAGEPTESLSSNVLCGWFYTLAGGELKLHAMSNRYCPNAGTENADGPFFRGDDAEQVTGHILGTREKVRQWMRDMREVNQDADTQLIMPATTACFRMTRRLAGSFTLEEAHMHEWFDDAIGLTGDWRKAGPVYAIPYRCIAAARTQNLLVAGRCISADNTVWDVTRAIPGCVVTGEAAGTAAALATRADGDVQAVGYAELRDRLLAQGVLLDPKLAAAAAAE